jgi:hypothetical protein
MTDVVRGGFQVVGAFSTVVKASVDWTMYRVPQDAQGMSRGDIHA